MSMVSSLSRECSDQAGASGGIGGSRGVHRFFDGFGLKWPEMDTARSVISRRHHPRKRMIQYSGPVVMESRSYGVLDTPLEPVIRLAEARPGDWACQQQQRL